MDTISRGLVRYEGPARNESRDPYGNNWQAQVDMATSCLAAAALTGGMPRTGLTNERALARYLSSEAAKKRRVANTKIAVIMLGNVLALAAGFYIGLLN